MRCFSSPVQGVISPGLRLTVEVSNDQEAAIRVLYHVECQHLTVGAIVAVQDDDTVFIVTLTSKYSASTMYLLLLLIFRLFLRSSLQN